MNTSIENIDQYISNCPLEFQPKLQELRSIILKAAPKATEKISYGMPAFHQYENLVYFAINKNHIGLYPHAEPIVVFKEELKKYKTSKGAIQIPLTENLPKALITKIVKFRLKAAIDKMESKKVLKTCKNGHKFYKSSDCPTCPECEKNNKPLDDFLSNFSAPARRALENHGIKTVMQLSKHTEKEILALHGMGKASLPALKASLKFAGLSFKK